MDEVKRLLQNLPRVLALDPQSERVVDYKSKLAANVKRALQIGASPRRAFDVLACAFGMHTMWPEVERELVGTGRINANSPVSLLEFPVAACFLHWKLLQAPEPPPIRAR